MSVNQIGAIRSGDGDKDFAVASITNSKRKPWEEIGNALNGFGSYLSFNINLGNSVFTAPTNVQGAFGD